MSARDTRPSNDRAPAGRRCRNQSSAPSEGEIATVATAVRRGRVRVGLTLAQWEALERVAPNGSVSELASLLIHRHAPRTPRAAADVIERLLHAGEPDDLRIHANVPVQTNLRTLLYNHAAVLRGAGYGSSEASLSLLIRAIIAEHTPRNARAALAMWCGERARIPATNPAEMQEALSSGRTVPVTVRMPGPLARRVDLARFELSAASPRALDEHLLSALIWMHADPADQDGLDVLMGQLVVYEGAASSADNHASLKLKVSRSLWNRLDVIAAAVYWRALPPVRLAAALLSTHTATSSGDPVAFEAMRRTCENYAAAARAGPGDATPA